MVQTSGNEDILFFTVRDIRIREDKELYISPGARKCVNTLNGNKTGEEPPSIHRQVP